MDSLGTKIGMHRLGSIRKYNNDGTVLVALNEAGLQQSKLEFKCSIPAAWSGPSGEFLGGYPKIGQSVKVIQGNGGEWTIVNYETNPNVLSDTRLFSQFKSGRLLGQVKNGNRFFLDPDSGFVAGQEIQYLQADPNRSIFSTNFLENHTFTSAGRKIEGTIKRDLVDHSSRSFINSFLESHQYNDSLFTIGMDPTSAISDVTVGSNVRNTPLIESKEIIYEFAHDYNFSSYQEESSRYKDPSILQTNLKNSRRENRTDNFSLSLEFPNHLIETVKGTAVDLFGNILDLNRTPLPIGKIDDLSLKNNSAKDEAFKNISDQLRKSLAFHFEINTRKKFDSNDLTPPDVNSILDYSRARSRFFFDVDKEGQFKGNFPASSETGNVALLARYENYSVLASKENDNINANSFARPENLKDIYLDSFSNAANIKITSGIDDLDGYASTEDRITQKLLKAGTVFHDITLVCNQFTKDAPYLAAGIDLVYFDSTNRLNKIWEPKEKIVSDTLIVSGPNANAGGHSGTLSFDGALSLNVGSNTIDKNSIIFDYDGAVVGAIGRNLQGISYAMQADGDVFLQVGGATIDSSKDSRFPDFDSAYRNGTFEIRVLNNGQTHILRIGNEGISVVSAGNMTFSSQQSMIFKSNSNIMFEAENIVMYGESAKRIVNRSPAFTTIG